MTISFNAVNFPGVAESIRRSSHFVSLFMIFSIDVLISFDEDCAKKPNLPRFIPKTGVLNFA